VQVEDQGTHFARVRVIDTDGYTGTFGPTFQFVVELPARR
jgi:hypothetical protein